MLGNVLAIDDPAASLRSYQEALALHRTAAKAGAPSPGQPLTARLLNNAAVMHYRAGRVDQAQDLIEEAIALLDSRAPQNCIGAILRLSLGRNLKLLI